MRDVNIAIVDYGVGNLRSVKNAFDQHASCTARVSDNPDDLRQADAIVLPGVGAFREGFDMLKKKGFVEALTLQAMHKRKPLLAVCLGMQFLMDASEEGGKTSGLGWISSRVRKFELPSEFRVPHIGWNNLEVLQQSRIFSGIEHDTNFYFVHSFFVDCSNDDLLLATCHYGHPFAAAIQKGNIIGLQFHPEKSHHNGLRVIGNFIQFVRDGLC